MQQRALVVLLVLVTAIGLGATAFREQVADAAQLLNVRVANQATDPVPVQQQGTARVASADATDLLLEDAFSSGSGFRMIDVGNYRQIRVTVGGCSVRAGSEFSLHVYTKADASFPTGLYQLDRIPVTQGVCAGIDGMSRTYEVPGRQLWIRSSLGFNEEVARVAIHGRRN